MSEYDFTIEHRPGQRNNKAGALSHRPDFHVLNEVQERSILLSKDKFTASASRRPDGPLQRVVTDKRKLEILQDRYDSPVGGHGWLKRTLEKVKRDFFGRVWTYSFITTYGRVRFAKETEIANIEH